MSTRLRIALVVAGVVAAAVVLAITRPWSDSESEPAGPRSETISIVVRGGKIEGGLAQGTVKQGSRVTIRVDVDVPDEVHLHGYDLSRRVTPRKPVELSFRANMSGRFELELEERGLQILDLRVEP